MIKKRILKTLAVMAVLLSLTAAPALAETPGGRLLLVDDNERTLGKVDLQTAMSGSSNFLKPVHGFHRPQVYGEYPTITPDGQTVVYAEAYSRNALYSLPLNKSVAPTRITTVDQIPPHAIIDFPVVSPDGKTVYFQYTIYNEDFTENLANDIYSVPIEGGDLTRVTHNNMYHWGLDITPDGKHFVYYDTGSKTINAQPVSGGPATPLYRCPQNYCNPDVSPDGTKVAFGLYDAGGYAVYTIPFSTTGGDIATKVPGSEAYQADEYQSVAFSPDGQYLAYDLRAETRVIPVGGGEHIDFVWGDSWSDDPNTQIQVAWAPASSDTTAPQIVVPDVTVEAAGPRGARVTFSAIVTDEVDPKPLVTCTRVSGSTFPFSGSTFPIGTTKGICTAEDASGNKASDTFELTVRDTTAPTITGMPPDIVKEATGPNGALVSWSQPTARDLVDDVRTVNCAPVSGSTFPIGETTVSCTATDSRNNTATKTFKVTVQDTTAPDISGVPNDMSVTATSSAGREVNFSLPTATDLVDDSVNVECSPASGTTFALGLTTVTCTATDESGNTERAAFDVSVVYDWSGVLQPVNADGSSIFKLGSTVPVRFTFSGDSAAITDATAKLTFTKIDDGIEGTVVEAASTSEATTGNLFRYDASSGQYVFNWSTKGLESGAGTYKLSIDLGDGTADDPQAKNHVVVSLKQ